MKSIYIDGKSIKEDGPCFIIAEIGQAHDGSLGSAHAYIDAVAEAGVDAVKFQTHIAHAESSKHEQFRVKGFPQDKTRYDYWKRMEFTPEQWSDLLSHAKEKGLIFLSTPFSIEAVELLENLNVPAFKIGSGDIDNIDLIESVIKTQKPILLSSGMSSYNELDNTVEMIKKSENEFAIFQCTTSYPCNAEDIGYNILNELKEKYNCHVGLSDHSGTIFPSFAAVTLGAKLIEVHATFSKLSFGPDTSSSLEIQDLKKLVEGVRFIERGMKNKIDKNTASNNRKQTKELFSRSAFYSKNILAGDIFDKNTFKMKKPGGGIKSGDIKKLLGKKIIKKRDYDDFVKFEDFE